MTRLGGSGSGSTNGVSSGLTAPRSGPTLFVLDDESILELVEGLDEVSRSGEDRSVLRLGRRARDAEIRWPVGPRPERGRRRERLARRDEEIAARRIEAVSLTGGCACIGAR